MPEPIFTDHALARWKERFPDLDIKFEWRDAYRSGKVGRNTKVKLRKHCVAHREFLGSNFKGYYYRRSKKGIIFVVAPPQIIVTAFKLPET
jgi:hypothetical protein